jgi:hypothetical protein
MNPSLLSQVSHQHITDMRNSAAHWTTARQAAARPPRARAPGAGPRSATGLAGTLVRIGLRLASSGDA